MLDCPDINIEVVKVKKTRNRPCKYTEEERKQRAKEARKKYYNKPEVHEKMINYFNTKYNEMTDEEKEKLIEYNKIKYSNLSEEEKKEFLIKTRPYKRKYGQRIRELKNALAQAQEKIQVLTSV